MGFKIAYPRNVLGPQGWYVCLAEVVEILLEHNTKRCPAERRDVFAGELVLTYWNEIAEELPLGKVNAKEKIKVLPVAIEDEFPEGVGPHDLPAFIRKDGVEIRVERRKSARSRRGELVVTGDYEDEDDRNYSTAVMEGSIFITNYAMKAILRSEGILRAPTNEGVLRRVGGGEGEKEEANA